MTNAVIRSLHDIGAAAWFGGSLMGAIGSTARRQTCTIRAAAPTWPRPDGPSERRYPGLRSGPTWSAVSSVSSPTVAG